ncbi:DNA cytosine methyltransferase [Dankookia sp. GCM10030260]|uniref:DNA cytosine methyltransferase n=1 Tax=Dankookia sp. GCM10030260 TaxID=3273390 RepID=UPI00360C2114
MRGAELFAGCGGLAMGLSRIGVEHAAMVEWDADAVATVEHNKKRQIGHVAKWPIEKKDIRTVDWKPFCGTLDLISGGPPCQPFGIGGKKLGHEDERDMWPEAVRAIREACPDVFVFENVRNLASPTFRPYLDWVIACLRRPDAERRQDESHAEHLARLTAMRRPRAYDVIWQVVNAADYGAPQIRHRVIIQGLSRAFGVPPEPLTPTHSRDRLLWDQFVTGEYWKRHGITAPTTPDDSRDEARIAALKKLKEPPALKAWVTLRDAIQGLGEPNGKGNHTHQPGARTYPGHTGSPLDLPSKALKAGDHGVPGGENMIRFADDTVRYLTLREAARLVGLPDDFEFTRSWTESMRQLGNAVPAKLAEEIGRHVKAQLNDARARQAASIAAE